MGFLRATLLCAALSLMAACGFQLRGQVDLPTGVEPIYIGGIDAYGPLNTAIRNLLSASGVALTNAQDEARYKLIILDHHHEKRTATLGEGARAAEYLLIESVTFELRGPQGNNALGPLKVSERRILSNDPDRVVSTEEEQRLLRSEMRENLAGKIARQLQAFDYQTANQSRQGEADETAP